MKILGFRNIEHYKKLNPHYALENPCLPIKRQSGRPDCQMK